MATMDTHTPEDVFDPAPFWPPAAKLIVTAAHPDQLEISWPPALDNAPLARYVVTINNTKSTHFGPTKTSASLPGLLPATSYTLSVRAEDSGGNLSGPLVTTGTTTDPHAPTWPIDATLSLLDVTDTSVTLGWPPAFDVDGVSAYEVWLDEAIAATTEGKTQATITGLAPSTTYTFSVVAVDGSGQSSAPSPSITVETTDSVAPMWPAQVAITVTDVGPDQATLTWPAAWDNVGVVTYEVIRDKVTLVTVPGDSTQVTLTGLSPGATVPVLLKARDAAGNVSLPGPTVTINTEDTTAPTWPEGASLLASKVTPHTATLAWTPAADDVGVTLYRVHRDGLQVAVTATSPIEVAVA